MRNRLAIAGVLIATVSICGFASWNKSGAISTHPTNRVIKRLPVEDDEPIALTKIKVKNELIRFDKPFPADDSWLGDLVFTVKNTSERRILFLSVQLQFPHPAIQGKIAVDDISYGNSSLLSQLPKADDRLVGLAPGESVELEVTEQKFLDLSHLLRQTGYAGPVDEVRVRINSAIFEDDSMWTRGTYTRRVPDNPSSWKNIKEPTN